MRHYQTDSPDAVARLIALALLADGAVSPSELQLIKQHDIIQRIGNSPERFNQIVQEFFADIQEHMPQELSEPFEIDAETLGQLLGEIRQPALQETVLRTMLDIVDADQRVHGGEAVLLTQAIQTWAIDLVDVARSSPSRRHRGTHLRSRSATIHDTRSNN